MRELLSVSRDGNVSVSRYLGMCKMLIMFVCIERGESVSEIVRSLEYSRISFFYSDHFGAETVGVFWTQCCLCMFVSL